MEILCVFSLFCLDITCKGSGDNGTKYNAFQQQHSKKGLTRICIASLAHLNWVGEKSVVIG